MCARGIFLDIISLNFHATSAHLLLHHARSHAYSPEAIYSLKVTALIIFHVTVPFSRNYEQILWRRKRT